MTFSIEIGRGLYLQFGGLDITVQRTPTLQLKEVFHLDRTRHLPHDIRRLAIYIPLYIAIGANDDLCRTMDIAHQGAVDPQITVAGDVAFHGGTGADQAGARARGRSPAKLK